LRYPSLFTISPLLTSEKAVFSYFPQFRLFFGVCWKSLVTGMIGIVFLGSLLLPRPLVYYLARSTVAKRSPQELNTFEAAWPKPRFVRSMYVMTWVWGLGLVSEAILRCWLAWNWPVERFLAIAPFIGYGIYFSLMGWSLWYGRRLKTAARQRMS
jgi:hypothetical protein